MKDLDINPINPKTGNEFFTLNNKSTDINLLQFWSWSQSDLINNTLRGLLAEFIVKEALEIKSPNRTEWDSFDLKTDNGIKIEIKSSAYIQSWKQNKNSTIKFNIRPTKKWDPNTNLYDNEAKRQSDLYIFCILNHKDSKTIDPLNLNQWKFYVLKTKILNQKMPKQKSIHLNPLLNLNPVECDFDNLKEKITTYNNSYR